MKCMTYLTLGQSSQTCCCIIWNRPGPSCIVFISWRQLHLRVPDAGFATGLYRTTYTEHNLLPIILHHIAKKTTFHQTMWINTQSTDLTVLSFTDTTSMTINGPVQLCRGASSSISAMWLEPEITAPKWRKQESTGAENGTESKIDRWYQRLVKQNSDRVFMVGWRWASMENISVWSDLWPTAMMETSKQAKHLS